MQRRGQRRWADYRGTSSGLKKRQLLIPANLVLDTSAAIKIQQVGTTPQQHVLAIVDNLPGARMLIRRSAAPKIRTALKQRHAETSFGESASSGQTSQSAPGNRDCRGMCRI